MWSIIGLIVSGIGVVAEYMANKEEKEQKDAELNELRKRVEYLENKEGNNENC